MRRDALGCRNFAADCGRKHPIFAVSAATGEGCRELVSEVARFLAAQRSEHLKERRRRRCAFQRSCRRRPGQHVTSVIAAARRVVVKIGSSSVTAEGRGLDHDAIDSWARQIVALRAGGKQVLLVSSGAIAEGMQRLGWKRRPHQIHELQAAAAVGQMGLAQAYEAQLSRARFADCAGPV